MFIDLNYSLPLVVGRKRTGKMSMELGYFLTPPQTIRGVIGMGSGSKSSVQIKGLPFFLRTSPLDVGFSCK